MAHVQSGQLAAVEICLDQRRAAAEIQLRQIPAICHDKAGQIRQVPQNEAVQALRRSGGGHVGAQLDVLQQTVGAEIQNAVQLLHIGGLELPQTRKDADALKGLGVVDAVCRRREIDRLDCGDLRLAECAVSVLVKIGGDIGTEGLVREGLPADDDIVVGTCAGKRRCQHDGKQQQQYQRKLDRSQAFFGKNHLLLSFSRLPGPGRIELAATHGRYEA